MLSLTGLLLLGACQKKSSESKTDQSAKTSQTSKKVSKNNSSSSSQAESGQNNSQNQVGSSSQAPSPSSSENQDLSQSQTNSNVNVAAVAEGDLSSIAGTYTGQNGGGINFTIGADGTGTISKSDGDFQFQFSNYYQDGQLAGFSNEYGWHHYVVPAGVATPSKAQAASQWDDSSHDRLIVIGEGVNVFFLN